MKTRLTLLFLLAFVSDSYTQDLACFSESQELKVLALMPYTKAKIGKAEGYFLMDFGTTGSTVDTNGFTNGRPLLVANTNDKFDDFDFFGSWGRTSFHLQDHSNIRGLATIKQAGIIGTDFLSLNPYLIDYEMLRVFRANANSVCSDSDLIAAGFKATSTAGFYANDITRLNNTCVSNIPTVPIKIGNAAALAQIDPGFSDIASRHSININKAFFKAIKESGIILVENPSANTRLTTCISGVFENVIAYKLPKGLKFTITGLDGNPIVIHSDVNIFLKDTPIAAKSCGGIGSWTVPAAQLGASFLVDAKKVIFDPYHEKVWFYQN